MRFHFLALRRPLIAALLASLLFIDLAVPQRVNSAPERNIRFAGLTWGVGTGWSSPGPGYWSDSAASVDVDAQGRLHLKIRKINGVWHSAGIFSVLDAQYGVHRFYIEKTNPYLDQIHPKIVTGPFLYQVNCGDGCTSELDIEISRWGQLNPGFNAQYVAQPYTIPSNLHRFQFNLGGALSTHTIDWRASSVTYTSIAGHYAAPPHPSLVLQTWTYTGPNIPKESQHVRIIFDHWLNTDTNADNLVEDEIIVTNAELAGVCRPAVQLACGQSDTRANTAAGATHQIEKYPGVAWPELGPEMAYSFTPQVTGPVTVSLSGLSADLDIFAIEDAAGDCSAQKGLVPGNEVVNFNVVAGRTYYLVVDGFLGSTGSYTIHADCSGALPVQDPPRPPVKTLYMPIIRR